MIYVILCNSVVYLIILLYYCMILCFFPCADYFLLFSDVRLSQHIEIYLT